MKWKRPEFVEIRMDAEINAYQSDDSAPAVRENGSAGERQPVLVVERQIQDKPMPRTS
jgi:coenzyme PQQ precursor peptide PqqA